MNPPYGLGLPIAFAALLTISGCGSTTHPLPCSATDACTEQSFVFATTDSKEVLIFAVNQNGGLGAPNRLRPGPAVPGGIAVAPASRELFVSDHAGEALFAYNQQSSEYVSAPGSPYVLGASSGLLENVTVTPDSKFLYVIGLNGGIFGFSIGSNGMLTPIPGSPFPVASLAVGSAIDSSGKFLFVVSGTSISSFVIDSATGALAAKTTPFSLPSMNLPTISMAATAGNFLYVALSGANAIAALSIDATTGALTQSSGSPFAVGNQPLNLTVTPSTVYVANSTDSTISAFSWNSTTGVLTEISGSPFPASFVGGEFAVLSGRYLYVPSVNNIFPPTVNAILGFSIESSGALTPLTGSPYSASAGLNGGLAVF